ncbi:MAG: cytidine deaminase, partial [Aquaticitalea sp.]
MKTIQLETNLDVFESFDELPKEVQALMERAKEARLKAYAPYSNFLVGAALLMDTGEIITGSNQENASYPSGLCAERTAVFYAGAQFPKSKILRMAIIAGSNQYQTTTPVPPCGACRQSIAEYEVKQES